MQDKHTKNKKHYLMRLGIALVLVGLLIGGLFGGWYVAKVTSPQMATTIARPLPIQSVAPKSGDLPATGSVKAVDSANTIHDPAWFTGIYDNGFRLYIIHSTTWDTCTPWTNTQNQLKMALDAGLRIAAYTRNPNCWEGGITAAGPYQDKLQFFAIDTEDIPGIPATRAMVDGIKSMGVRPVIYTGAGMWPGLQGGTAGDFSDVPLWDTDTSQFAYDAWQVDYLVPTPNKYGGWNTDATMRIGVQQQFEYKLDGIYVDLNSFDVSFLR